MKNILGILKNRQVVSTLGGSPLGYVSDIVTDPSDLRPLGFTCANSNEKESLTVPLACIQYIGNEIVLVNMKNAYKKP